MLINAYHRFAAKKSYDRLNPMLLVLLTHGYEQWVMTRDAYRAYVPMMSQLDLASHRVDQIDPMSVDLLPDSLVHIWTKEDIDELKKVAHRRRVACAANKS